jgi:hypothetical protein
VDLRLHRRSDLPVQEAGGASAAVMLTKEEFITDYCQHSSLTRERFDRHFVALSCRCGSMGCDGWAVVARDPESQARHLDLYGPEEAQS